MLRIALPVVIAVVLSSGCAQKEPDPVPADVQFKEISDRLKGRLTEFLATKESRLNSFEATIKDEERVDERMKFPQRGVIRYSYAVTKPEGGAAQIQVLNTAVTVYQWPRDGKRWIYSHTAPEGNSDYPPKESRLVQFEEVQTIADKNGP